MSDTGSSGSPTPLPNANDAARLISAKLVADLSSFREHGLQRPLAFAPGQPTDRLATLEAPRRFQNLPTAPGVSNPPSAAEISGAGPRNVGHDLSPQARDFQTGAGVFDSAEAKLREVESWPQRTGAEIRRGLDTFIDDRMRDALRSAGVHQVSEWNGAPREGRFVHVDDRVAVQSAGRGGVVAPSQTRNGPELGFGRS